MLGGLEPSESTLAQQNTALAPRERSLATFHSALARLICAIAERKAASWPPRTPSDAPRTCLGTSAPRPTPLLRPRSLRPRRRKFPLEARLGAKSGERARWRIAEGPDSSFGSLTTCHLAICPRGRERPRPQREAGCHRSPLYDASINHRMTAAHQCGPLQWQVQPPVRRPRRHGDWWHPAAMKEGGGGGDAEVRGRACGRTASETSAPLRRRKARYLRSLSWTPSDS